MILTKGINQMANNLADLFQDEEDKLIQEFKTMSPGQFIAEASKRQAKSEAYNPEIDTNPEETDQEDDSNDE
jgi:hypothetical protein